MKPLTRIVLLALISLPMATVPSLAQTEGPDLGRISIEDLLGIEITSASRKQQRTEDVAAAVFVITQEDIRRSGITTIPNLLRMAPGVDVAQVNANNWAVSVRGFNGSFADKLLVLIDGRSVYSRIFSGVLWDTELMMVDDIDRIEVIRGPGAAIWGANAVNGVINIVTKTAADTQGGLARVEAGGTGEQGAVRYGGALGSANYRVYSQWSRQNHSLIAPGIGADDGSHSVLAGFRTDWNTSANRFMVQGNLTNSRIHALWFNLDPATVAAEPISTDQSSSNRAFVLGRWTRTRARGSSLQVQAFVDAASRHEPIADYDRRTFDVDAQYHTALGVHHDVVVGGNVRVYDDNYVRGAGLELKPAEDRSSLLTAFVQDEIGLFGNRLAITLGSQIQRTSDSGSGVQPNARVMWKAKPRQRFWASVSRALRTPSRYEQGIQVNLPPVPTDAGLPLTVIVMGNRAFKTETFVDAELGYRLEFANHGSVDVTGFMGHYDHLRTQESSAPVLEFEPSPRLVVNTRFDNLLQATTRGLEVAGHWAPIAALRFDGSYTAFHLTPTPSASSQDPLAAAETGNAPETQWQLRSAFSPSSWATLSAALFRVGPIDQQVGAYLRADLTAEWQFSNRLSLMAIGQNLFDDAHAEFSSIDALLLATQARRSVGLRLRWTFR